MMLFGELDGIPSLCSWKDLRPFVCVCVCVCVKYERKMKQRKNKGRNFFSLMIPHCLQDKVKTALWCMRLCKNWPQLTPLATWPTLGSSHTGLMSTLNMPFVLFLTSGSSHRPPMEYPLCLTKVTFQPGLHVPEVTHLDSLLPLSWGSSFSPMFLLLPGFPQA